MNYPGLSKDFNDFTSIHEKTRRNISRFFLLVKSNKIHNVLGGQITWFKRELGIEVFSFPFSIVIPAPFVNNGNHICWKRLFKQHILLGIGVLESEHLRM